MSSTTTEHDRRADRIAELVDRVDIEMLINRLGRCLDERDFEGLRELFDVDAQVHTPGGTARGHDALVDQARHRHSAPTGIQHIVTNRMIDVDGDRAEVRANLLVAFAGAGPADPSPFLLGEVYRFRFVRTADGWRISRLSSAPVWTLNRPASLVLDA